MSTETRQIGLLVDFGSTFTKGMLVDLQSGRLLAAAREPSTVDTDVTEGLRLVVQKLESQAGVSISEVTFRRACSSAAGGLRMVAIGLVRELTGEAARQAALGAGARLLGTYVYPLTDADTADICSKDPDIVLLAGGTDGGNERAIIHNAEVLARAESNLMIVVAGNKVVSPQAAVLLQQAGHQVALVDNVLPDLGRFNVEPARQAIREIFSRRITRARGLKKAAPVVGALVMPTPAAVLSAGRLLAAGTGGSAVDRHFGELLIVDVGGATTDVHSVADGSPKRADVRLKGPELPLVQRTVEGDVGMRVSAPGLLSPEVRPELQRSFRLLQADGVQMTCLERYIEHISSNTGYLAQGAAEELMDAAIAMTAVRVAAQRHAGRITRFVTPTGTSYLQEGKDLTGVKVCIGTGGVFTGSAWAEKILCQTTSGYAPAEVLLPMQPERLVDRDYCLWGVGLLADSYPQAAWDLACASLRKP